MDIIIFAIVAIILCYRLYTVLGRDDGPIPQSVSSNMTTKTKIEKANQPDKLDQLLRRYNIPLFLKPAFSEILLKDPTFDFKDFLEGAEGAYELILKYAFLHDLAYVKDYVNGKAIDYLNQLSNIKTVRIHVTEVSIVGAEFHNPTALITVQFKSKIQDKSSSSNRLEDWVFKRDLNSDTPTWILEEIITLTV
jgi:predicted lipid-binding transport protein (Tim44 family)